MPKEKNEKVTGLMKDDLYRKIMTKFVGLRSRTYSYWIDDSSKGKKAKCTKNVSWNKNLHLKVMKTV